MARRRAVRVCIALSSVCVLLAGCGSTVHLGATAETSVSGDGLTPVAPSATSTSAAGGAKGGAQPGTVPGSSGSVHGSTNGGASGASTAGSSGVPANQAPPGSVTAKTISIGFIYTTGRQDAAAALGAAGVTSGDELAQWKLLIDEVNAHGGLGGRTIKPVFFGQSNTSGGTTASSESAACATFTQDNHVAAALSSFEFTSNFLTCMEKKGIPTFYSLETVNDTPMLQANPLHFEASNLALDRQGTELAASLARTKYFTSTPPAINGIITYDVPEYVRAAKVLEDALKAQGQTVKITAKIRFADRTSDTSNTAAAISNAELRMASAGVNHVMIFDLNGLLSLLFMTNAESQGYRPRYGLTSQSSGSHLADLLGASANGQLTNATGIGWIPVLDLSKSEYPGGKGPAARETCRRIMIKGGQSQGLSSPGAELVALGQCDDIFMLQKAFRSVTGAVSGSVLQKAIEDLGAGFATAQSFSTRFGSGRHDGVSAARDMAYVVACKCFRYTSGLVSLP